MEDEGVKEEEGEELTVIHLHPFFLFYSFPLFLFALLSPPSGDFQTKFEERNVHFSSKFMLYRKKFGVRPNVFMTFFHNTTGLSHGIGIAMMRRTASAVSLYTSPVSSQLI